MKFHYKKVRTDVIRPIIPIEIGHNGFFVDYEVLVDSGADSCIFDAEMGELLGIDIPSGKKYEVFGVTDSSRNPTYYYVHPITIKVGGWEYKINAGFLPRLNNRYHYGIVGQEGFFNLFVVTFDLLKQEVELKQRN